MFGWPEYRSRAVASAFSGGLPGSASPGSRGHLGLAGPFNLHYSGWQVLALEGGWLRKGGIHSNAGVWTMGARQQLVDNPRPRPASRVGPVISDPAGRPEKGLV